MADIEPGFDRTPPQDIEAEQYVLGCMMLSRDAIEAVQEHLEPDDYYRPAHEIIHAAIMELYAGNEPVDALTVSAELKRRGALTRIGSATYLHTLISAVSTTASAAYYARIVRERAQLRRLVSAGTRIVQMGHAEAVEDVNELIDSAQAEIFALSQRRTMSDYLPLSDLADPLLRELDLRQQHQGLARGIPSGLVDLDKLTAGLHPGQMIIIAARPGMGKSTLAMNLLRSAAIAHNRTAVIFSLEMSRTDIGLRLLSAESGVRLDRMLKGQMNDADWQRVSATISKIQAAPLFIDDSPNMMLNEIRAKCRRLKQQHDLQLVVVDYLQLLISGKRVESRQQEVSEFSRSLKLLAKELEVPVIAVAQLNRGPESRTDKKPMMSDLRESGSLEQDADIVMLLHRPDYYDPEVRQGEVDIIVAKHRNGETATISASFQGHFARLTDMASEDGRPAGFGPHGGGAAHHRG